MVDYEQQVASTFLPLVDAARHLVVTSGYMVVVVLTAMFAFHVAGWTVCRCLRLPTAGDSGFARRRRLHVPPDSSVQTFIRHQRVDVVDCYDDDDDDDASDYDDADSTRFDSARRRSGTSASGAHARRYDVSPMASSVTAAACSPSPVEFKYSETNV